MASQPQHAQTETPPPSQPSASYVIVRLTRTEADISDGLIIGTVLDEGTAKRVATHLAQSHEMPVRYTTARKADNLGIPCDHTSQPTVAAAVQAVHGQHTNP